MHLQESQEICSGRSAYGDSQDEWSKGNDSFQRESRLSINVSSLQPISNCIRIIVNK